MGYTVELYAISLDRLVDELRTPTLDPAQIDTRPEDDEVLQCWPALAAAIANALAGTGGELSGPLSDYLHLLIRHLGHWYGSLAHTSSGGEQFRTELLGGPVSNLYGRQTATHLLNRERLTLSWTHYPLFGWLTNTELQPLAGADGPPDGVSNDDEEALWTLIDIIDRAAHTGQDLITVYG